MCTLIHCKLIARNRNLVSLFGLVHEALGDGFLWRPVPLPWTGSCIVLLVLTSCGHGRWALLERSLFARHDVQSLKICQHYHKISPSWLT